MILLLIFVSSERPINLSRPRNILTHTTIVGAHLRFIAGAVHHKVIVALKEKTDDTSI
jgi:hypothetical protein